MSEGFPIKVPAEDEAAIFRLKGRAVFSTDHGKHKARTHSKDQPVQIRSDYECDRAAFIAQLRKKFPVPCIKLRQEDLTPSTVLEYFDDFDVHFYSPTFLYEVLGYMARANEIDRAARSDEVEAFVNGWIDANREAFTLLDPSLEWDDMFHQQDMETRSFPFLWDAFTRIMQINKNHNNAKRLEDLHAGNTHYEDGDEMDIVQSSPNRHYSSAPRQASVPGPPLVSHLPFPLPIYHAQRPSNPAYFPHSLSSPVYFQAPRRQSTTSRVMTRTTPIALDNGGPPIYQAPMRPLVPQNFIPMSRNTDRVEVQSGSPGRKFRMTRKDFHSDPLTQAWIPKPGYSKNFHVLYSYGDPGPFQYHRFPTSNRQRSYHTNSNTLHRGIRNPPKPISDDARTSPDTLDHDSPDWIAATALPPNHGLAPESHTKRPSRTSSFGSGRQRVDYRNRDPDNVWDALQSQTSSSAHLSVDMDNESVSKPRFLSNPFAMNEIMEEYQSPVRHQDQSVPKQQEVTSAEGDIQRTLQKQQVPSRKWPQPISHQPQTDLSRDPLAPISNAGYNRSNLVQPWKDMSSCKLWVGNLSPQTTRSDLFEVFIHLPGFVDVIEPRGAINSKHRWTFIEFRMPEDIELALSKFPSIKRVKGRKLSASRARPFRQDGRYIKNPVKRSTNNRLETCKHSAVANQADAIPFEHQSAPTFEVTRLHMESFSPQANFQVSEIPEHMEPTLALIDFQETEPPYQPPSPPDIENESTLQERDKVSAKETTEGRVSREMIESFVEEPRASLETPLHEDVSQKDKIDDDEEEIHHETSQSPRPHGLQSQTAVSCEHEDKENSPEFSALFIHAKPQRDALLSSDEQTVPNVSIKSFAQVASQGVLRSGDGASDVDKLPSVQELPSKRQTEAQIYSKPSRGKGAASKSDIKSLTKPKDLLPVASCTGTHRHRSRASVSYEKQHIPQENQVSSKESKNSDLSDRMSLPGSQPMTRDSSIISAENTSTTSPALGPSTAITTHQYASPRGSFKRDDDPAKSIEVVAREDTGIDANHLRSRLESATAEKPALSDAEGEEKSLVPDVVKTLNQNSPLHKDILPISTSSVSPASSQASDLLQAERPVQGRAVTPPPSEPISTHKKKSRSKPTTPIRKTFQGSSKPSQSQTQPASFNPLKSPLAGRVQYPSIQNDLVTVLEPPHAAKATSIKSETEANDISQPLNPTSVSPLVPEMSLTCQQLRYEKHTSTPLTLAQRVARLLHPSVTCRDQITSLTSGVQELQNVQHYTAKGRGSSLVWVDASHESVKVHFDLASLCSYKLRKLAAMIKTAPKIAREAAEWQSKLILMNLESPSDRLTKLIVWNAQVAPWVDSLPQFLIFDDALSQHVASHGTEIEQKLEDFRLALQNARDAGFNPPGATSAQLADKVTNILDDSPRNGRFTVTDRLEIEELIVWIHRASEFIDNLDNMTLSAQENGEFWRDSSASVAPVLSAFELCNSERVSLNGDQEIAPKLVSDLAGRGCLLTKFGQNEHQRDSQEADALRTQIAIHSAREKLKAERAKIAEEAEHAAPSQSKSKSKSKTKSKKRSKTKKREGGTSTDLQQKVLSLEAGNDDEKEEGEEALSLQTSKPEELCDIEVKKVEKDLSDDKSALREDTSAMGQEKHTYPTEFQLHKGLTENEYIYTTANQRFLTKEPLFGVTGNVWDYIPQSTPWGPTDMEAAMKSLKERAQGSERDKSHGEPIIVTAAASHEDDVKEPEKKIADNATVSVPEAAPEDKPGAVASPGHGSGKSDPRVAVASESKKNEVEAEFGGHEDRKSEQETNDRDVVGTPATSRTEKATASAPVPSSSSSSSSSSSGPATAVKRNGKDAWRVPSNEPVWGSSLRGGKRGGAGQGRGGDVKGGRKGRAG